MKPDPLATPEPNMTVERLRSLYELIGRMNSVYELQELLEFVVDQALSLDHFQYLASGIAVGVGKAVP